MSIGDTTVTDAPSSPNADHIENTFFNNDTMAAFEKGPKGRLSYDRLTNYSVADMSLVETAVTDSTEAPSTAEAFGSLCHSSENMFISDNTFREADAGQKATLNLNATQYSNIDMSLNSTVDCSSRESCSFCT
ncbi:unnamed protein product [Strongylus vulgaris]|uniref:Uncharacterized protein n=1 Tax=Strongylus vulgaris TaxID=40348 RepID=A0A3P7ISL9_STRVU|nr:unnamed protein product [Strongylus vulgaris]